MQLNSTKIKLLMAEAEINHQEMAERCDIPDMVMDLILRFGTCSIGNATKIANALYVDVTEIISGKNNTN